MIQIKASFSKKNNSRTESCAAEIAVDLSSEASDVQIKERLDQLFGMMKTTTEKHLNSITIDCKPIIERQPVRVLTSSATEKTDKKKSYSKEHSPASDKQLSYLESLALKSNISLAELLKSKGFSKISDLTMNDCNSLIQSIK